MKEWFTIAELEALALPDMPTSHRALSYAADQWRASGFARKRPGKGGGYEYSSKALPSAAILKLTMMDRAANGAGDEKARQKDALWARYNALSSDHKEACNARLRAVLEAIELEALGTGATAAMQIAALRHGVSAATLYNWRGAVQPYDRADWLAALAPSFVSTAKRSDCDPRAWEFLVSDYLRPEEPRFTSCYRRMEVAAKKEGWAPIPSERSLRRRLDAEIPEAVQTMARQGQDTAKKLFPAQRRDRTSLRAMQAVNMDGHKLDVFVRVPWSEKPVRLYLLGIQDLHSGKMLSWRLSDAETWEAVQLAVGDMVETYGIPEEFVLDNGRAFASKKITGGSRTRFRFKIREEDPEGLLTALGCNLHWTQPYSGQSKPIERTWKDCAEEISRHPFCSGAYTGNKPDAKPENYATRAIPLADMHRHVSEQIAIHNARTGRKAAACAGRSFDETFAASMADPSSIVTRATAAQRALWLLASEVIRAQKGSGEIHFQGNRYWAPALNAHAGQKVTLRFDPDRLHDPVKVYDLSNRLICEAACIDDTGFFDQDAARLHHRARRDHLKAIKAQEEAVRKLSAQELADILYRGDRIEAPAPPKPAVTRIATSRKVAVAVLPAEIPEPVQIDAEASFARAMRLIRGGLED